MSDMSQSEFSAQAEDFGDPFRACLEQTDVDHDTARVGNQ